MEFSTNRKEIAKLIKIVSSCVGSRNMLPILSNVMIEANENMVHFTCASLEQRVSAFCVADTAIKGATTVPAKKLLSLLNAMSGDEVDFAADNATYAAYYAAYSAERAAQMEYLRTLPNPFGDVEDGADGADRSDGAEKEKSRKRK